ncbi:MAG: N-acetylmuramoyl-L-alanine amidase [Ruminococcaceae bacterium]|nr:N-acetylmuramoyl-L-alanine amidase [Oscillospiraceae bacterium]
MKICIDAGHNHSGADTGAKGRLYLEQDLTFLIADELKKLLKSENHEVIMTRNSINDNTDTRSLNASLSKRVKIANDNKCDFFISVHINAGGGVGFETYVYSKSSLAYERAVKIQDGFRKRGRTDRGVKVASFYVLKNTNMPSLLVECGFIDNKDEEKWIMENYKEIARIIASAFGVNVDTEKEYANKCEAISVLEKRGIICEAEKWYHDKWTKTDVEWLLRKMGTYLM